MAESLSGLNPPTQVPFFEVKSELDLLGGCDTAHQEHCHKDSEDGGSRSFNGGLLPWMDSLIFRVCPVTLFCL